MPGFFKSGLFGALLTTLSVSLPSLSAPPPSVKDPCAKIAGKAFVVPADAFACQKAFPFNETLRQNVLQNVARVFDFFTFEDYYLNSPPPFQESTSDIRAEIARINATHYATDYDFNRDLYDFITQLNDGHTRWFPNCYNSIFENILPAPIVTLEENGVQNVFIAPDSDELLAAFGSNFTDYFDSIKFNWKRLAGATVLSIAGLDPYDYVDHIASTVSGNYLDHGVRVNSVFSSYRIVDDNSYSQRVGDLAGPPFVDQSNLTMTLILVNSTKSETVTIPYLANFLGVPFTDSASYWENNCAANDETNGVDIKTQGRIGSSLPSRAGKRPQARAAVVDRTRTSALGLPGPYLPTQPQLNTSAGQVKSYILPDKKTGVLFVGSFDGDYVQFQTDTVSAFKHFNKAGVSQLLIDVTNNGGGYVCLGQFLHQYLAGSEIGYAGFQSTTRGNTLARKIVQNQILLNVTELFYSPSDFAFFNGTEYPNNYDYYDPSPPLVVNGRSDTTSQRFFDDCTPFDVSVPKTPPIPLTNIAIVGNGNCASTCAMFTTLMNERHNTKIAVFGGKPGEDVQFKGMAGNQVLEWTDLDTEIKSANLKDDPLAPPDLLVNADFRHNWRIAWSYFNESLPIAYVSELPKFRFAYTKDTYNNPQNVWIFAAKQMLG